MKIRTAETLQEPLLGLTGYVLRRASTAALSELSQRLASFDLRPIDAALLMLVDAMPEVSHSEVAETLGLRRPNLVPLVAALGKRGLLERKRLDFRSEGLVLTESGRALFGKVRKVIVAHEQQLIERVPLELRPLVVPILMALWGHGEDKRAE